MLFPPEKYNDNASNRSPLHQTSSLLQQQIWFLLFLKINVRCYGSAWLIAQAGWLENLPVAFSGKIILRQQVSNGIFSGKMNIPSEASAGIFHQNPFLTNPPVQITLLRAV